MHRTQPAIVFATLIIGTMLAPSLHAQSLADAAKRVEAQRATPQPPSRVYTNGDLAPRAPEVSGKVEPAQPAATAPIRIGAPVAGHAEKNIHVSALTRKAGTHVAAPAAHTATHVSALARKPVTRASAPTLHTRMPADAHQAEKTVHVRAYTKKDGTHVATYNRRPPSPKGTTVRSGRSRGKK